MQNTIQLPQDLYDAIRKKAVAQQRTTDALVIEWVSEHRDEFDTSETTQVFEQEIAAFERLQPELCQQYGSQYVAIFQGDVIGYGWDKFVLLRQVYAKFGEVPCFIERADATEPRTVRMPFIRVVGRIQ